MDVVMKLTEQGRWDHVLDNACQVLSKNSIGDKENWIDAVGVL